MQLGRQLNVQLTLVLVKRWLSASLFLGIHYVELDPKLANSPGWLVCLLILVVKAWQWRLIVVKTELVNLGMLQSKLQKCTYLVCFNVDALTQLVYLITGMFNPLS